MDNGYLNNQNINANEQETNIKKSKNKGKVLIIILAIIIIGLISYIIYNKLFFNKNLTDDSKTNNNSSENNNNNSETVKNIDNNDNKKDDVVKLSKDDKLIVDLSNIIESTTRSKKGYYYEGGYFFQFKKIYVGDLSSLEKFAIAFKYLNPNEIAINKCSDLNNLIKFNNASYYYNQCINSKLDIYDYMDKYLIKFSDNGIFNFNFKEFQKTYQNILGSTENISESFTSNDCGYVCKYDSTNQNMICTIGSCGGTSPTYAYAEADYALKYSDYIELYDYYINIDYSNNSMAYDKDSNNLSIDKYNGSTDFNQKLSLSTLKEIGQLYKHTFKQNSDGSYYWYSSEPVK